MKVTGYRLQHAIREAMHLRDVLAAQFGDNVKQFASSPNRVNISNVYQQYRDVEQRIAALQVLQARYNLHVHVVVLHDTVTLMQAVKQVGGAGRCEKMWREASGTRKRDRYREDERSRDVEYAELSVPVERCMERARDAHRFASALREAIQVGNATVLDMEVGPGLLDAD
jgi:hypothetical protein